MTSEFLFWLFGQPQSNLSDFMFILKILILNLIKNATFLDPYIFVLWTCYTDHVHTESLYLVGKCAIQSPY